MGLVFMVSIGKRFDVKQHEIQIHFHVVVYVENSAV
jgi:hypothetical protein